MVKQGDCIHKYSRYGDDSNPLIDVTATICDKCGHLKGVSTKLASGINELVDASLRHFVFMGARSTCPCLACKTFKADLKLQERVRKVVRP